MTAQAVYFDHDHRNSEIIMALLESFYESIRELLPTGIALVVMVLIIFIVRYFLDRHAASRTGGQVRRQLLTILLSFIGLVIVIMAIPDKFLSETSRGQILSLIGILLSAAIALSSTTLIGNAMAGMMLRIIRSFRPGDFVRVGDHFGRVTERGLFHIEIQTEDRDLTTLPNLYLVTNPVKVIRSSGTIVSADVSLGYDNPHGKVESVLKDAALAAELSDPFVLIMELGDFSVTYRAAGMLSEVKQIISSRSRLRQMMLDKLHENGIEIVSPTFMNTRALPIDKNIIPDKAAVRSETMAEGATPEKIVFDKAEEAESLEKLNGMYEETGRMIESLKTQLKEINDNAAREKIKSHIDRLEARRVRLAEYIKARNEPEK